MTASLVPEPPLLVLPQLAQRIGLNEAILLQQLHFWTQRRKGRDDGWIYNTVATWREQFPFLSEDTIKRTWASLKKQGYVEIQQRRGSDRTNSYRVVYDKIRSGQNPLAIGADSAVQEGNLTRSLEQAENNAEKQMSANADAGVVIDLFEFWSTKLGKRSPKLSDKRKRKVRDRLREGFTADEIRAAIVGLTLSDHHMGRNGSPRKYDDLELICRDPEHLEGFRDLYLEKYAKGKTGESAGERMNRRRAERKAEREGTA